MRRLVIVLVAVLVAGCDAATVTPPPSGVGVEESATSSLDAAHPAPSSAAVDSPAPSPTQPPSQAEIRKLAAKAYLAAVQPTNKAFKQLFREYKNQTSLPANRRYCAKLAATVHAQLKKFAAMTFPADTAQDARALIRQTAAEEAQLRTCAKARNWATWDAAWARQEAANNRAHEVANLVRLDLDLPPVPG